jgi:hypothetical protein
MAILMPLGLEVESRERFHDQLFRGDRQYLICGSLLLSSKVDKSQLHELDLPSSGSHIKLIGDGAKAKKSTATNREIILNQTL